MPIHPSWVSMIRGLAKQYKEGDRKCRKLTTGKKVCASKKAWSVFFGKVTKDYGKGAEKKSMPSKKSEESHNPDKNETENLEKKKETEETFTEDDMIDWLMKEIKNG